MMLDAGTAKLNRDTNCNTAFRQCVKSEAWKTERHGTTRNETQLNLLKGNAELDRVELGTRNADSASFEKMMPISTVSSPYVKNMKLEQNNHREISRATSTIIQQKMKWRCLIDRKLYWKLSFSGNATLLSILLQQLCVVYWWWSPSKQT